MPKPKKKDDPSKYVNYQFAFRLKSEKTLDALQAYLNALCDEFNEGRDQDNPKGKKAVKINAIVLKALIEGLQKINPSNPWKFEKEEELIQKLIHKK
jgi:hypothetical protein